MEAVLDVVKDWLGIILAMFAVATLLRKQIVEWMRRSLDLDEKGGDVTTKDDVAVGISMSDLTALRDHMTAMFDRVRNESQHQFAAMQATVNGLERTVKNGLETRTERVEDKTDGLTQKVDRLIEGQARLEGRFDQRRQND